MWNGQLENSWERQKPMRKSVKMNSTKHNVRQLQVMLLSMLMLAGCATRSPEIASGTPTQSTNKAANATCIVMTQVRVNRGKPGGATTEDISAALDKDHPIERVRNLVGDTSSTLTQVDANNARLSSLCGESNGAPPR